MKELAVSTTTVVEHWLITWIPWLIGIVAGGGLGVLWARGLRVCFSTQPQLRQPAVLLPWRTLVMGLLMVAWSPIVVVFMGLGATAGGVMVGVSVFLLAQAFTAATLVDQWYPPPLGVQLIAGIRTLAVASGLFAVGAGIVGGGGLGRLMLEGARLFQVGLMWQGLLVVLASALGLDLLLGVVQMVILQQGGGKGEPVPAAVL